MNTRTLSLEFGALCAPVSEQLTAQGFVVSNAAHLDSDQSAISRLMVRGLLSHGETTNAWKRLRKDIVSAVQRAQNPRHPVPVKDLSASASPATKEQQ